MTKDTFNNKAENTKESQKTAKNQVIHWVKAGDSKAQRTLCYTKNLNGDVNHTLMWLITNNSGDEITFKPIEEHHHEAVKSLMKEGFFVASYIQTVEISEFEVKPNYIRPNNRKKIKKGP